nr:hypothetical protein [Diaphorobacter sp. JS3050]
MGAVAGQLRDAAHDHALRTDRGQGCIGIAQRAHHMFQDHRRRGVRHVVATLGLQRLACGARRLLVRKQREHMARGVESPGRRGHARVEGERLHGVVLQCGKKLDPLEVPQRRLAVGRWKAALSDVAARHAADPDKNRPRRNAGKR